MNNKKHTVTVVSGLETYQIGKEANITLQPSTGYVSVSCPWHSELNGCHWWTAIGNRTLHEFLMELDRGYVMTKLFDGRSLEEYDEDRTKQAISDYVIQLRKDGSITKSKARHIWNEITWADSADDIARLEGIDCPYEFIHYKPKRCVAYFWDEIWASFIEFLRNKN